MLKINLVPFEELDNKRWFVPDLLVVLILAAGAGISLLAYEQSFEDKIASAQEEISTLVSSQKKLETTIKQFASLQGENEALREQLASLEHITTAKVPRYRPVMLMEMLQNLKPQGLWFKAVEEQTANGQVTIRGESYDKLLVAHFISALHTSRNPNTSVKGVGKGLYFSKVHLKQMQDAGEPSVTSHQPARETMHFELSISYREQPSPSQS